MPNWPSATCSCSTCTTHGWRFSACSTAHSGAQLPDEALHVAAAFQLAGFVHTVGTLRPVDDEVARDVAVAVYDAIGGGDVGAAVATATIAMRDAHPTSPSLWASHVHLGRMRREGNAALPARVTVRGYDRRT